MHGGHHIESWSKAQAIKALSSAASELYAIVKSSAGTLGLTSTSADLGLEFSSVMYSDASAALGIIQMQGLGRTRHIDCNFLFVQYLDAKKVIRYAKVSGHDNPSDMCTKGLRGELIKKNLEASRGEFWSGIRKLCARI